MEMGVVADGRPQGPHPHVHILSRPYYTRSSRGPLRPIVGASGVRSGGEGPRGRPSYVKCIGADGGTAYAVVVKGFS